MGDRVPRERVIVEPSPANHSDAKAAVEAFCQAFDAFEAALPRSTSLALRRDPSKLAHGALPSWIRGSQPPRTQADAAAGSWRELAAVRPVHGVPPESQTAGEGARQGAENDEGRLGGDHTRQDVGGSADPQGPDASAAEPHGVGQARERSYLPSRSGRRHRPALPKEPSKSWGGR